MNTPRAGCSGIWQSAILSSCRCITHAASNAIQLVRFGHNQVANIASQLQPAHNANPQIPFSTPLRYVLSTTLALYNKQLVGKNQGIFGKGSFPGPACTRESMCSLLQHHSAVCTVSPAQGSFPVGGMGGIGSANEPCICVRVGAWWEC